MFNADVYHSISIARSRHCTSSSAYGTFLTPESPSVPPPSPDHHFLAQPLRLIRLDQSPVPPSTQASSVTPRKCNADVYAQYPSRHYTSPSVCNSPHTEKPKRTTPDHHTLAHPLRRIRLDVAPCGADQEIERDWPEARRCTRGVARDTCEGVGEERRSPPDHSKAPVKSHQAQPVEMEHIQFARGVARATGEHPPHREGDRPCTRGLARDAVDGEATSGRSPAGPPTTLQSS